MKTLLDEHIDTRCKAMLSGVEVYSVFDKSWDRLKNGELRRQMEQENFKALITADKNMPFQQNLATLTFAIILMDLPVLTFDLQKLFLPKIQQFLSDPPVPLPKIVHVSVDGISKGTKIAQLQRLLSKEALLLI